MNEQNVKPIAEQPETKEEIKIEEQENVLKNNKKNMLVSASAGSGKTHIMMKYITSLIAEKGLTVQQLLVLTFTKAAAAQMKERLLENLKKAQKMLQEQQKDDGFLVAQIDAISCANISTIHAFCEKCIKKYANLLNLSANFSLLDEEMSLILKRQAFEKAYALFEEENEEEFALLSGAFKNDKTKLFDIVCEIEKLANSVADKEKFLQENMHAAEKFFDEAVSFLVSNTKQEMQAFVQEVESLKVLDFETLLKNQLQPILCSNSILELSTAIRLFQYPKHPTKKEVGQQTVEILCNIRESLRNCLNKIANLNLDSPENLLQQRGGGMEKNLTMFFGVYEAEQEKLKLSQNCLDFSDLEKYMAKLSLQENLFDGLKYVFVDEYQDTNKIQEKIVKNVAKNCNFVAVGDAKQGIYGFRLASAEIFLNDLQTFQSQADSNVNFLKCNFRTNQKVLDFVNNVFEVCMTKELTGVDYATTSKMQQVKQQRFVDDGNKAVYIDIVCPNEKVQTQKPQIYSVMDAQTCDDNKFEYMLLDIKRRILEVTSSNISVDGVLRKANFSDIAILARGRKGLFNQLGQYLAENDIPVLSNSKSALFEEPQMKMLLCFLKLVLVLDDDVACVSVLSSALYGFSLEALLQEKNNLGKNFCEIVKESSAFAAFLNDLQLFRKQSAVFGLKKTMQQFLAQKGFFAFINLNHPNLRAFVEVFLNELEKFDFNLPEAIAYFESVKISVSPQSSLADDGVLLTTIHDSKGLEYPIVFLINCDADLFRSRPKAEVEINERFGLALKVYDEEANTELSSARMLAVKLSQKEKAFVEELMIFYVALTRAKNRLYLFGLQKDFVKQSLKKCNCYLDFVFYALQKQKNLFLQNGKYEDENLSISLLEKVEEQNFGVKQNLESAEKDEKVAEKIENYLNFSYKFAENENFKLKENVTSLSSKNQEDVLAKFNGENFSFSSNAVEKGNAYHLALKAIDFQRVEDLQSLQQQLQETKGLFDESLIDKQTLLENILILKPFTKTGKVFKEKEFLMKEKVCNLLGTNVQEEILVQGVVDLFVVDGNKAVLVDYKYSQSANEKYLLEKYCNQLKLYKHAIENAFAVKETKVFLLSLKNHKLICANI